MWSCANVIFSQVVLIMASRRDIVPAWYPQHPPSDVPRSLLRPRWRIEVYTRSGVVLDPEVVRVNLAGRNVYYYIHW